MPRGHEHISFVFLSVCIFFCLYFWALFLKFSWNKIVMGEKILVPCLDVIMIAFF